MKGKVDEHYMIQYQRLLINIDIQNIAMNPPTRCSHGVSPVTRGVTGQIVLELGSNTAARSRWPIDPGAD